MSVSFSLSNYKNQKDKDAKIDQYKGYLKQQQELNELYEQANIKYYSDKKLGITPPPVPEKSAEEKLRDTVAQREMAMSNLSSIISNREANSVLNLLDRNEELVLFNRYFDRFKKNIEGIKNLTPNYVIQLWQNYKMKLLKGSEIDILVGDELEVFEDNLQELADNIVDLVKNRTPKIRVNYTMRPDEIEELKEKEKEIFSKLSDVEKVINLLIRDNDFNKLKDMYLNIASEPDVLTTTDLDNLIRKFAKGMPPSLISAPPSEERKEEDIVILPSSSYDIIDVDEPEEYQAIDQLSDEMKKEVAELNREINFLNYRMASMKSREKKEILRKQIEEIERRKRELLNEDLEAKEVMFETKSDASLSHYSQNEDDEDYNSKNLRDEINFKLDKIKKNNGMVKKLEKQISQVSKNSEIPYYELKEIIKEKRRMITDSLDENKQLYSDVYGEDEKMSGVRKGGLYRELEYVEENEGDRVIVEFDEDKIRKNEKRNLDARKERASSFASELLTQSLTEEGRSNISSLFDDAVRRSQSRQLEWDSYGGKKILNLDKSKPTLNQKIEYIVWNDFGVPTNRSIVSIKEDVKQGKLQISKPIYKDARNEAERAMLIREQEIEAGERKKIVDKSNKKNTLDRLTNEALFRYGNEISDYTFNVIKNTLEADVNEIYDYTDKLLQKMTDLNNELVYYEEMEEKIESDFQRAQTNLKGRKRGKVKDRLLDERDEALENFKNLSLMKQEEYEMNWNKILENKKDIKNLENKALNLAVNLETKFKNLFDELEALGLPNETIQYIIENDETLLNVLDYIEDTSEKIKSVKNVKLPSVSDVSSAVPFRRGAEQEDDPLGERKISELESPFQEQESPRGQVSSESSFQKQQGPFQEQKDRKFNTLEVSEKRKIKFLQGQYTALNNALRNSLKKMKNAEQDEKKYVEVEIEEIEKKIIDNLYQEREIRGNLTDYRIKILGNLIKKYGVDDPYFGRSATGSSVRVVCTNGSETRKKKPSNKKKGIKLNGPQFRISNISGSGSCSAEGLNGATDGNGGSVGLFAEPDRSQDDLDLQPPFVQTVEIPMKVFARDRPNNKYSIIDIVNGYPILDERYREFGKYFIYLPSLKCGILDVRSSCGKTVAKLPKQAISAVFVDILHTLIIKQEFDSSQSEHGDCLSEIVINEKKFNNLSNIEQELLKHTLEMSKIRNNITRKEKIREKEQIERQKEQRNNEIERFNILRGQISAGNNAPELISELKDLVVKFIEEKTIPHKQGMDILLKIINFSS